MNRITQLKTVQEEAAKLFERKNKDYGDAFANYGPIGVIVRMGDKINRLSSVTNNGINLVKTESIRDTLIDLHNYSAMAIMLMDEDKKDISQNSLPRNDSYAHELSLQDNTDLPYSARWPNCSSPKNTYTYSTDLPINNH